MAVDSCERGLHAGELLIERAQRGIGGVDAREARLDINEFGVGFEEFVVGGAQVGVHGVETIFDLLDLGVRGGDAAIDDGELRVGSFELVADIPDDAAGEEGEEEQQGEEGAHGGG